MKNSLINTIMQAARATNIPAADSGLWFIRKAELNVAVPTEYHGQPGIIPPGIYTHLYRMTEGTMHKYPPGVVVMEDTPFELRTHLQFMLKARGKVLVTGLGLGCVVRGLLANPAVEHVTCIENSSDVLWMVDPYMPKNGRLTIIYADALKWTENNTQTFDFAWHDLWTNREAGEPLLDEWHVRLIFNCKDKVTRQGAWNLQRVAKQFLASKQMKLMA
ncbi:MAG: hypothetical protein KJ077_11125 [Anaerolineae bacterium]|nr:hypothetical protein [Anaerolineae bacterium]